MVLTNGSVRGGAGDGRRFVRRLHGRNDLSVLLTIRCDIAMLALDPQIGGPIHYL